MGMAILFSLKNTMAQFPVKVAPCNGYSEAMTPIHVLPPISLCISRLRSSIG